MNQSPYLFVLLTAACSAAMLAGAEQDKPSEFALRDGDTVVFLGDSITAARTYGKIVEDYTLLRFPDRKIQFYNAGRGGDTAAGGLARLDRDVFVYRPTVLIVAYGVNDIGWGLKADAEHKLKYLDGIRGIVRACQKQKVRVFICSAAVTAADPETSENSFLQEMCDEGMDVARKLGEQSIDVQRTMRDIQRRIATHNKLRAEEKSKDVEPISLHVKDGVHLSDLGQVAMAYAILKGLGAPAEVSSVHLDAGAKKLVEARACQVADLSVESDRIKFSRHDQGLPFNHGLFFALHYLFVPLPEEMNRYLFRVENLAEGRYALTVDARGVGTFSAQQLAKGVNIASATADAWQPGGPWDAQGTALKEITEARHDLFTSGVLANAYLATDARLEGWKRDLQALDENLVALQRKVAQPRPYQFELRRVDAERR